MSDDELCAFLDEQMTMSCATIGPGGRPHLIGLWYVREGDQLRGWTYAKSQKARNLERDPRAKPLVPGANKPVLFYGIESLAAAGITDIGIVISPDTGDEIRAAAGDGDRFGVSIRYIEQDAPRGLAHAVLAAEEFLGDSSFVMYLGDNLLRDGIVDLVRQFRTEQPDALILLTPVPDPEHYGVAELDGDRVARLVEKPDRPAS